MHEWTLDEDTAAPFFRQAVESGVTFWDTANVYQGGTSEEFVGRAIRKFSRREDIVLATKVHGRMHDGPGGSGLSRKAVLEQLDASLHRLGTDYVDVYYIHRFDDQVPVEETMETLHDVVKAGKVRAGRPRLGVGKARRVCPIVGATKPKHLQDAVEALAVNLSEDEMTALQEPYAPQDNYCW